MMANTKLEMTFKNVEDNRVSLSLDSPRVDLTDAEVSTVMNDIITRNIFNSNGGDLVSIVGARVVTTSVEELTV